VGGPAALDAAIRHLQTPAGATRGGSALGRAPFPRPPRSFGRADDGPAGPARACPGTKTRPQRTPPPASCAAHRVGLKLGGAAARGGGGASSSGSGGFMARASALPLGPLAPPPAGGGVQASWAGLGGGVACDASLWQRGMKQLGLVKAGALACPPKVSVLRGGSGQPNMHSHPAPTPAPARSRQPLPPPPPSGRPSGNPFWDAGEGDPGEEGGGAPGPQR
jgi:hypothetical protein